MAPAVVEYSPLTVIRAESPGFVREICVHEGDLLSPRQVVVRLANDELQYTVADLRRAWEQSVIKGRMYFRDGELAKYQVELANQESLRKRQAEVQGQVDALTVRTPVAGRIVARNLPSLVGQYLTPGAEIVVVGDEAAKQLVVAVPQEDSGPFVTQVGKPIVFRIRGASGETGEAGLTKLDPRASLELPHPALGAHVGGPIAVRMKATPADAVQRADQPYELLSPRFFGTVVLTPAQSRALYAGQLGTVQFRTAAESAGVRLVKDFGQWLRKRLQHPQITGSL
jgi:multidrug efflux pump subunit AcrA (membrane-fusion protein)